MVAGYPERRGDLVVILVAEVSERERHAVALGQLRDGCVDFRSALGGQRFAEPIGAGRLGRYRLDFFIAEDRPLAAAAAQKIETVIPGDAHDPSYERLSRVAARQRAIGAHERFLRGIFRALGGAE